MVATALAAVSLVTSEHPPLLTKRYELGGDGSLQKTTIAHLTSGRVELREFATLSDFSELLQSLQSNQGLTYGVPFEAPARLVTERAWAEAGRPTGTLPRTEKTFSYCRERPGILALDYDPPDPAPLARDELVARLRGACPELATAEILWWPSAGSCIWNGEQELRGVCGQRLYLLVKDAADIPRAGKALVVHLWAAGEGYVKIASSGSLLARTLFDESMWQASKLDFAAGAVCREPLTQRRGAPVLIQAMEGDGEPVDTSQAIPEPSADLRAAAEGMQRAAKADKSAEATEVRHKWINHRMQEIVKRMDPEGDLATMFSRAREVATLAVERRELFGDWIIQVQTVDRKGFRGVTVSEILDNPNSYHGLRTLDPLEPEYDGGRPIGKLLLYGARPVLHSFAHGGCTFRLFRQPERIELVKGRERRAVDELLARMREASDLFDYGNELVAINEDRLLALTAEGLRYFLGGLVQFWSKDKQGAGDLLRDPPVMICKELLALREARGLKALRAIITEPTLRANGTLLARPGYDPATRLLYQCEDNSAPIIPDRPSIDQARAALRMLWKPFHLFPFSGAVDRAVHLAALLTAPVRPVLPTSPAFGYDAPIQGSGKTLFAECVAVLATGRQPEIWPHTSGNEEEVRKRLFAALREGSGAILWDNIPGLLHSPVLAGLLTAPTIKDRVLCKSEAPSVPNTALVLLTGNNLTLAGDLTRRVLVARIDPQTDQPYARRFDFDPLPVCLGARPRLIEAILTLLRGWLRTL
jgi:hypothetical protein